MRWTPSRTLLAVTFVAALGSACGSKSNDSPAATSDAGAGDASNTFNTDGSSATPSDGGPEVCDGVDNDGDGIIDNVDAKGDGICDCLSIATIGRLGTWSSGTGRFEQWLDARNPKGTTALGDQVLTRELLDKYQVIVLLNAATVPVDKHDKDPPSHAYSAAESAALADWVAAGGGLVTTIGYIDADPAVEIANVNALLASLDVAYNVDPPGWTLAGDIDVTDWLQHPIAEGVTAAHVQNGIRPAERPGTTTVAWAPGKNQVLVTKETGVGHVAMWGDEWITYSSDWENATGWQIERLWLNLFKWLTPAKSCKVAIPIK